MTFLFSSLRTLFYMLLTRSLIKVRFLEGRNNGTFYQASYAGYIRTPFLKVGPVYFVRPLANDSEFYILAGALGIGESFLRKHSLPPTPFYAKGKKKKLLEIVR